MEELSAEELDAVLRAPQPTARRNRKKVERTHRDWFYGVTTFQGSCDNPDCSDPRKTSIVYVWTHPDGQDMCRFCFLKGWLDAN